MTGRDGTEKQRIMLQTSLFPVTVSTVSFALGLSRFLPGLPPPRYPLKAARIFSSQPGTACQGSGAASYSSAT